MNTLNLKSQLSLKSAIFGAMMICASMIGTSDVWAAFNAEIQQEGKWNISIYEILKDCGFSNEFISKLSQLSPREYVEITTSIEDSTMGFNGGTGFLLRTSNITKFPKQEMKKLFKEDIIKQFTELYFPVCKRITVEAGFKNIRFPKYARELYSIVNECMNKLGMTGLYMDCDRSKKEIFAKLLEQRINCSVLKNVYGLIRLKISNSYIIDLDIFRNNCIRISVLITPYTKLVPKFLTRFSSEPYRN